MGYKIAFMQAALKEFNKLDNSVKRQIQAFLDKLCERDDPRRMGDPLKANLACLWRYRVGDYRIVAEIKDEMLLILVLAVAHRRDVYKKPPPALTGFLKKQRKNRFSSQFTEEYGVEQGAPRGQFPFAL